MHERLNRFYIDFRKVQFSVEWIRLYFFSALYDIGYNERWISMFEKDVFPVICDEVRAYVGFAPLDGAPPSAAEIEFIWGLQAAIFYHGVRKHLFHVKVHQDLETNVEMRVANFLASAMSFYENLPSTTLPARTAKKP